MINFYAAEHSISNIDAIPRVFELYGLEFHQKKLKKLSVKSSNAPTDEKFVQLQIENELTAQDIINATFHLHETDYFSKRGISHSIAEKYSCGYIEKWVHPKRRDDPKIIPSPRVIIPTSSESYIARSTDNNKIPKIKAGETHIFNIEVLKQSQQNVVIVEGEFDALSIIEAGNDSIALGSTVNVDKFIDWLKKNSIQPA